METEIKENINSSSFIQQKMKSILQTLKEGKMIILTDDTDRENEGDLVCAASTITPEQINFMAKYGRGLICVAMEAKQIDQLGLPLAMKYSKNQCPKQTAFTQMVDSASPQITTGISAFDRAFTIKQLVNPQSTLSDFTRPGHVPALRAKKGGVFTRRGHTEGSTDLMRLAHIQPGGAVICEIMDEDGTMLRGSKLSDYASFHNLPVFSIQEIISYLECTRTTLPIKITLSKNTYSAVFEMQTFWDEKEIEYPVLIMPTSTNSIPVVRIHSKCTTGDLFGSLRCDCKEQFNYSLKKIGEEGGVFIYMENQEGRGIGLTEKLRAYQLQDQGVDTFEANLQLGYKKDERDYSFAISILKQLHITKVRILTNQNKEKIECLKKANIEVVEIIPIPVTSTIHNHNYLECKKKHVQE